MSLPSEPSATPASPPKARVRRSRAVPSWRGEERHCSTEPVRTHATIGDKGRLPVWAHYPASHRRSLAELPNKIRLDRECHDVRSNCQRGKNHLHWITPPSAARSVPDSHLNVLTAGVWYLDFDGLGDLGGSIAIGPEGRANRPDRDALPVKCACFRDLRTSP